MKKLSIGVRLTLWYVVIFAVGELVFGAGMWIVLRNNLYRLVDDNLESQVEDVKSFLKAQKKDASVAELRQAVDGRYNIQHSGDYLEIYLETGELIYRSTFLQENPSILVPPERIQHPLYRSRQAGAHPLRFAYQHIYANGHIYAVEMGIPADRAVETLHLFRFYLLIFAPLLLLVLAGVGYWMSRGTLVPVDVQGHTTR
jgi:hypothetical protein